LKKPFLAFSEICANSWKNFGLTFGFSSSSLIFLRFSSSSLSFSLSSDSESLGLKFFGCGFGWTAFSIPIKIS